MADDMGPPGPWAVLQHDDDKWSVIEWTQADQAWTIYETDESEAKMRALLAKLRAA